MTERKLFILAFFFVWIAFQPFAQETGKSDKVTGEAIYVEASSASVLEWFRKIEEEKDITISYNPSNIDTSRICKIMHTGNITVGNLLQKLLEDYRFTMVEMPQRKILIRIDGEAEYLVSGAVADSSSSEKLYCALVSFTDGNGKKIYSITDENGFFRLALPPGNYNLNVSYVGFEPKSSEVHISGSRYFDFRLNPISFEIEEVNVARRKNYTELSELAPSGLMSFSGNDLFSQIWILPGVTGTPTGNNFLVDGGSYDENRLLLDGVPVFHPGHINALLPQFNGDVIKNIVFHKGFFPARLEGSLSSVTEFNLKDGNMKEHRRILSVDMPAASVTLEGPLVKDKLSYVVGIRRSWLDFFDRLFSAENRLNHNSLDINLKLTYNLNKNSSLKFLAYNTYDEYLFPIYEEEAIPAVKWNSKIYKLSFNRQWGKLSNTSSVYYSSYYNMALSEVLGFESKNRISNSIKTVNASTEFTYSPENIYSARWGARFTREVYNLASFGERIGSKKEPLSQVSLFYENDIRVTDKFIARAGIHLVGYIPDNYRSYYSAQPRLALNYSPTDNDLLYINFSRMEQFYHYLSFNGMALPTDFRMPSIEGFRPRTSEHYETGWKRNLGNNGKFDISVYYKTRRNVVALKPGVFVENDRWKDYIMSGEGDSYGLKMMLYYNWRKWIFQASYTYSRSREWFGEYPDLGKLPSLYDIPHYVASAVTYNINKRSALSLGCLAKSGKVIVDDYWIDDFKIDKFRRNRFPFNYRIDAGYTFRKDFGDKQLFLRCGLYNILGNPPEEDIIYFYTVHWSGNCMPYAGVSFRF